MFKINCRLLLSDEQVYIIKHYNVKYFDKDSFVPHFEVDYFDPLEKLYRPQFFRTDLDYSGNVS